ncbi:MAG: hypothetical protein M3024_07635, partial [Candidatus Dormibacteraeota bacterium]|nr:hypothetical protein [Candidatus Dormibacteraeota bacterium]
LHDLGRGSNRQVDADGDWVVATERLPTPHDRIRAWVAHSCSHLAETSPVLHHLPTVRCAWPPERYRQWVTDVLVAP